MESGAFEFAETESFLAAAERIAGPYEWGRYDLLLLPPSFPYGGMENPCLTFVTPTLLAGDRSLANVVAHEIAHSWTGNLVTNARSVGPTRPTRPTRPDAHSAPARLCARSEPDAPDVPHHVAERA